MDQSTLIWVLIAVPILIWLDLLFVEVRRAIREAKRIARRLAAYAELPIFSLLAATAADAERLPASIEAIQALSERGERAFATIRGVVRPNGSFPG